MAVIAAVLATDNTSLSGVVGEKWICISANRSGATSFSVTPNPTGNTWQNRLVDATLSTNETARRSLAIAELSVQQNFTSVSTTAAWNTGGASCIWIRLDSDYPLFGSSSADSSTTSVAAQGTGTVASAPAGDVLVIAGVASRGGWASASWDTADISPDVSGSPVNLLSDTANNALTNACAGGVLELTGASSQSYTDEINVGTSRLMTAGIVVFVEESVTENETTFAATAPQVGGTFDITSTTDATFTGTAPLPTVSFVTESSNDLTFAAPAPLPTVSFVTESSNGLTFSATTLLPTVNVITESSQDVVFTTTAPLPTSIFNVVTNPSATFTAIAPAVVSDFVITSESTVELPLVAPQATSSLILSTGVFSAIRADDITGPTLTDSVDIVGPTLNTEPSPNGPFATVVIESGVTSKTISVTGPTPVGTPTSDGPAVSRTVTGVGV